MKIESSNVTMVSEHLSSVEIQEEQGRVRLTDTSEQISSIQAQEVKRGESSTGTSEQSQSKKDITLSSIIIEQVNFSSFTKDEAILLRDISSSLIDHINHFRSTKYESSESELKYSKTTVRNQLIGQVFDSKNSESMNLSMMNRVTRRTEGERLSYNVDGIVKTKDGQEIDINIALNLSRDFIRNYDKGIIFSDPLVINYNASTAQLSNTKFAFDIDTDGLPDQISMLRSGSGYLSLDYNGDGKINNGSELFGTKSGDGFADLAMYDDDKNNWIDENDAIFNKLRIWVKDPNGEDKLLGLGEVGVGAIYLVNSNTEFTLTNETGVAGQLKQSSIFIKENGDVGIIQNIDHALKEKKQA